MKKLIFTSIMILFLTNIKVRADEPEILGVSAVMTDAATGFVIYSKNPNERLYPASTTKLMTVLLALEYANGDYKQEVTFTETAVDIEYGSSSIGMTAGERLTLLECLYAVLLPSANEVSNAVGEHIAGSIEDFALMMTERARELGCLNTNFKNPHGLHDEEHYTTAYDMTLIMKACITQPDFLRFAGTAYYEIPPNETQSETRYLTNTNRLIQPASEFYNEYVKCGKTGYTDEARHTLVTYSQKDGARLICAVMKTNKNEIFTDTTALVDYGASMYGETDLLKDISFKAPIEGAGDITEISLEAQGGALMYLPKTFDISDVEYIPVIKDNLTAPIEKGERLGYIELSYNGSFIANVDVAAADTVSPYIPAQEEDVTPMEEPTADTPLALDINLLFFALICTSLLCASVFITLFIIRRRKREKKRYDHLRDFFANKT